MMARVTREEGKRYTQRALLLRQLGLDDLADRMAEDARAMRDLSRRYEAEAC